MKQSRKIYCIIRKYKDDKVINCFLVLLLLFVSISCSTTRTLEKNQLLYNNAEIDIADEGRFKKLQLKSSLNSTLKPKPNDRFLGLVPFKLWTYNFVGDSLPEKGFRRWVRNKFGEAPVIYKDIYASKSVNSMREMLFNKGYFNAKSSFVLHAERKKATVKYSVKLNNQFTYDSILYPANIDSLTNYIYRSKKESLLKSGKAYDLQTLKEERVRVSDFLKSNGFYAFDPSFLIFKVDSNNLKSTINIQLKVKERIPKRAEKQYYIRNITVDTDYSLVSKGYKKDSAFFDGIKFLFNKRNVKLKVLSNSVMIDSGDIYNSEAFNHTLNKLSGLGIYKFTNVEYSYADTDSSLLDISVYLTEYVPRSVRSVFQAVTKSNDYMGPELTLSYRDRNFLKGAELFTLNLNTSFETQLGNQNDGGNSYEVGLNANLSVPRFLFPFIDLNKYLSKRYTPKTNLRTGYNYHFRTKYFKMNTFNFLYGYNWQETKRKSHDIRTINLNYSRVTDRTKRFETILEENDLLEQSFKEQLILSLSYTYRYNSANVVDENNGFYLSLHPEFAGQFLSLYNYFIQGYFPAANQPAKVLGIKYSQYARLSTDIRYYFNISTDSKIACRFLAGVGKAYGNSEVLPYNKQYYVGGASDLRAFFTHSLGPGSYYPSDTIENSYFEHVGELKLEGNLEYRFGMTGFLKGAVFLDVGNVWLLDSHEQKSGGKFAWNTFANQLAVGAGFGLRFDASVLVLRLDLGVPLRKPWLPKNNRWVINAFDPGSAEWRRNNLVLNIAIGYPF